MTPTRRHNAFTLIELLIVVAVLALLVSLLLPSLSRAKTMAKAVKAHAELRGITAALTMYRQENGDDLPPTRFSCSSRAAYDLPLELSPYLPVAHANKVDVIRMPDPFTPALDYKYRAPGAAIVNESTILERASKLWVPAGLVRDGDGTDRYHSDRRTCPVRYAVWSMGPDPTASLFDIPGRLPLPPKYWRRGGSDAGVIVHFEDDRGHLHQSP